MLQILYEYQSRICMFQYVKSNARYHECVMVTLVSENGILPRFYET